MLPNPSALDHSAPRSSARELYRFLRFELDARAIELRVAGSVHPLAPRTLVVLVHLLRNRDRVVPAEELLQVAWGDVHVGIGSLRQAVWELRSCARKVGCGPFIRTSRGRGYRFSARVESGGSGAAAIKLVEQRLQVLADDDLRAVLALVESLARARATYPGRD